MESRVPVPTDNIFKFYALFGLLLFVFACGALLYVNRSANEVVFAALPELEGLKELTQPNAQQQAQIALLQRKLEISQSEKKFFVNATASLGMFGLGLMAFGFFKWHTTVQPVLDRIAEAQAEIAELQLAKLRREVGTENAAERNLADRPREVPE